MSIPKAKSILCPCTEKNTPQAARPLDRSTSVPYRVASVDPLRFTLDVSSVLSTVEPQLHLLYLSKVQCAYSLIVYDGRMVSAEVAQCNRNNAPPS